MGSDLYFLAKFMITSHRIAEEKCSLLFTILERSGLKSVVCTILASFPDLLVRHPNTMEPWTKVGLKIQNFHVRENLLFFYDRNLSFVNLRRLNPYDNQPTLDSSQKSLFLLN